MIISHWLGWCTVVIGIGELLTYFARKFNVISLKHFRGKHHIAWGKWMIIIGLLHGVLASVENLSEVLNLNFIVSFFSINLGTLSFMIVLFLFGTYNFRKKIGAKWIVWHRNGSFMLIPVALMHILIRVI